MSWFQCYFDLMFGGKLYIPCELACDAGTAETRVRQEPLIAQTFTGGIARDMTDRLVCIYSVVTLPSASSHLRKPSRRLVGDETTCFWGRDFRGMIGDTTEEGEAIVAGRTAVVPENREHVGMFQDYVGERVFLSSSTATIEDSSMYEDLEKQIESLFRTCDEDYFEDGTVSSFSRELCAVIDNCRNAAIELIAYWFLRGNIKHNIMSEALRWLGRIEQAETHSYRLWLLGKCIESQSVIVRDGALLGIAALDDPHSTPTLRSAIEKEKCEELRIEMQSVLKQLEDTAQCR